MEDLLKYKLPIAIGALFTAIKELFGVYIFTEWHIAGFVFVAVGVDTLTGVWRAAKRKQINSAAYGRIIEKVILYFLCMVLAHVLTNFTSEPGFAEHLRWVRYAVYFTLISREVLSSVENIEAIRPGTFPEWLTIRLKKAHDTGDIRDLIAKKDENDNHSPVMPEFDRLRNDEEEHY
jgi:phage-related holin